MAKEELTKPSDKLAGVAEPHELTQESSRSPQDSHTRVHQLHGALGNRKVAQLMRSGEITPEGKLVPIPRGRPDQTASSAPSFARAESDLEPEISNRTEGGQLEERRHAVRQGVFLQRSSAVADANPALSGTAPSATPSIPGALPASSVSAPGLQSTPVSSAAPGTAGAGQSSGGSSTVPQAVGQPSTAKQSATVPGTSSGANAAGPQSVANAPAASEPTQSAPPSSATRDPATGSGKSGASAPVAKLDTTSESGLLSSLAAVPASAFGEALSRAAAARSGIEAKQKSDLTANLPEIHQPTGLPVKGEEKQVPKTALQPGRSAARAPAGSGGAAPKAATAAAAPVASGPLPAAHVSTAAAEPADDAGGSWWDWLTNKVKNFVSSLPTSDPGLSTSAGPRPQC